MFARYFTARGYVVFAIDYRHAPRWRWPAQLEDVRAALRVDPGARRRPRRRRVADRARRPILGGALALLAAYLARTRTR